MSDDWLKKDIKVFYKGVDITEHVGTCVCRHCLKKVRASIDKDLQRKERLLDSLQLLV